MKINIGSQNPNKINAVKEVWQEYALGNAEIKSVIVASEVPAQPISLNEMIQGATNRAKNAFDNCNLSIGIESGLMPAEGTITGYLGACCCAIYDGKEVYIG
ncbi:DUF84 family protein, partial [Candidatus Woesearchaeota archaeon]|nr:DUF84 family protein [Candidatus Woesearchaeota archaeon]